MIKRQGFLSHLRRQIILAMVNDGQVEFEGLRLNNVEIGQIFGISRQMVRKIINKGEDNGNRPGNNTADHTTITNR